MAVQDNNSKPKRVRRCVACGKQSDKVELFRIVRTPEGEVVFDLKGRRPGRGAYVCSVGCLETALKTKRIDKALKKSINKEEAEEIMKEVTLALSTAQAK